MELSMDCISPTGSVRQHPAERMVCRSISSKKFKAMAVVADCASLATFERQSYSFDSDILEALDFLDCPSEDFIPQAQNPADLEHVSQNDELEVVSLLQEQPIPDHICPHADKLPKKIKKMPKSLELSCQYTRCEGSADCSLCLTCGKVFCGEDGDQHMGLHMIKNERHSLCLYLHDFSVFCARCNTYIDVNQYPKIQDIQERLLALRENNECCNEVTEVYKATELVQCFERQCYPRSDSFSTFSLSSNDSYCSESRKRKFVDEIADDLYIDFDWSDAQF